jgi:large subunit ribosomal protein L25
MIRRRPKADATTRSKAMQIANVTGETRKIGGRHANERLRLKGLIPAIIYGHGEQPEPVSLSQHELEQALHHKQHVLNLGIGDAKKQYFIKEVQYDHLQKNPIHVDLMRVDPNERIKVRVKVELRGTPAGIAVGGETLHQIADLEIECKLLEIPDTIRVKVDHLNIGQSIHVKELELPPDVKALHHPEEVVCAVRLKKIAEEVTAAVPAEGAEAAKGPEVIERGKKEEEEAVEEKK